MINEELLRILRCTECKNAVEVNESGKRIHCMACGEVFRIKNNVPVFYNTEILKENIPEGVLSPPVSKRGNLIKDIPLIQDEDILSFIPDNSNTGSEEYILDYGCGNTNYKNPLERRGYRYIGIDVLSDKALVLADGHKMPFADGQFSHVFSRAVLEHMINPFVAVKEINRVMKEGGLFFGSVAFLEPYHQSSCFHMTYRGCYNLLQYGGFNPINIWLGWDGVDALLNMGFIRRHKTLIRFLKYPLKLLIFGPALAKDALFNKFKSSSRLPFAGSIIFLAKKQ